MATHTLGKLKFNLSRQGLAYKWGDGEVRRYPFPSFSRAEEDEYEDGDYGYEEDYEEREDGGYYEEEDDRSSRRVSRFADSDDDGYEDESSYYDDDEDDYADYEDEDYEEPSGFMQYIEDNDWVTLALLVLLPPLGIYLLWRRGRYEQPMRIGLSIASLIWFLVLLFLLIPALFGGSRDRTTHQPQTMTLTTQTPIPNATFAPTAQPSVAPTVAATAISSDISKAGNILDSTALPGATSSALDGIVVNVSPSATPLAGTSSGTIGAQDGDYVYSPSSGIYYHAVEDCPSIPTGVTTTRMALSAAQNRGQTACPVCYGGTLYYATTNGTHYHSDPTCSNMVNPVTMTQAAAEAQGKTACPVCILHTKESLTATPKPGTKSYSGILSSTSSDRSGMKVWATAGGNNYHTKSNCRGMTGAQQVTLLQAIKAGKTACSTCCPKAGTKVWCTKGGTYYHSKSDCTGMTNAQQVTYAEALVLGKRQCPTCITSNSSLTNSSSASGSSSSSSGSGNVYVYATPNGKYYHTRSNCGGMTNASRVTLAAAIKAGRPACPTCAGSANNTVYAKSGGKYYHSKSSCQEMSGAPATTLAKALAAGFTKCPYCWGSGNSSKSSSSASASSTASPSATKAPASTVSRYSGNVFVYGTPSGKYYHTNSTCGDMHGAQRVSLEYMLSIGRQPCPVCAKAASRTVYGTKNDKYYHYSRSHAGSGATSGTLAEALAYGLRACPTCVSGKSSSSSASASATAKPSTSSSSSNFKAGTSGIKVYASVNDRYYHAKSTCPNASNPAHVALEIALNAGKTACPNCASAASRTVYASPNGNYYHYNASHAGSNAKAGKLSQALAYGLKPCPSCVGSSSSTAASDAAKAAAAATVTSTRTYKTGTSGIKVYATVSGKYYHANSLCSGISGVPARVTLETALNYGKTACPVCASKAGRTVYGKSGDHYYHYSSIHAGSGAKSGSLAKALAYGLKACPVCVSGTSSESGSGSNSDNSRPSENSGNSGSSNAGPSATLPPTAPAPVSGSTSVYINLNGGGHNYHLTSRCSSAGMSSGTAVTLNFALDQGFSPCPYCNPPRSTSD